VSTVKRQLIEVHFFSTLPLTPVLSVVFFLVITTNERGLPSENGRTLENAMPSGSNEEASPSFFLFLKRKREKENI
jgi:hypothetical protein